MDTEYWAATEDRDQLAEKMAEKVNDYHHHLHQSGRIDLYRRAVQLYHGLDPDLGWKNSAAVTYGGVQGELTMLRVNHFRALLEHVLVMTTGERPTFSARAINSDYTSHAQTELAEGLVQYYLSERGMENRFREAAEYALLFGEGWVYLGWDVHAGDDYGVEEVMSEDGTLTQKMLHTGDIETVALEPIDVIRDYGSYLNDQQWYIVHRRVNKWDLAAKYPEFEQEIIYEPTIPGYMQLDVFTRSQKDTEDTISTFRLVHARTASMPEGRNCLMVGGKALSDGPLGYKDLPLIPMVPSVETRGGFGYSRMWDLMALQEGMDSIASTLMTNHDAFGVQNVWTPKGSDLSVEDLSGGLKHWESHEKPESVNLLESSPDSYRLAELFLGYMQELVGLNDVARGQSAENVESASHAALLYSAAVQFNSNLQKAFILLQERASTHLIRVLQTFAQAPQIAEIAGQRSKPLIREFKGDDLGSIHRVSVEIGSPLQRNTAGKLEIAQQLVTLSNTRGVEPITPKQYLEVLATGNIEPVFSQPESQRRLVEQEAEHLLEGQPVQAVITDEHAMHIREHSVLFNEPTIRQNDQLVRTITEHIQQHIDLWVNADPNILAAMGQAPPQVPPPVAGALASGGVPEGSPAPGVNPGADNLPMEGLPADPGMPVQESGAELPAPPIDPMTGTPLPQ